MREITGQFSVEGSLRELFLTTTILQKGKSETKTLDKKTKPEEMWLFLLPNGLCGVFFADEIPSTAHRRLNHIATHVGVSGHEFTGLCSHLNVALGASETQRRQRENKLIFCSLLWCFFFLGRGKRGSLVDVREERKCIFNGEIDLGLDEIVGYLVGRAGSQ